MKKKHIELLAPAGDFDCFKAAVEAGADAVYVGVKSFNARENASNFDMNELNEAVEYAHIKGVKVYLTLNVLILDNELNAALDLAVDAYNIGVDALIVQDIGFASLLKELYPQIDIHASTQLTTHNIQGVKFLKNLGFSRVVLARENSLSEIKHITNSVDTEIEIFIHGALCISYSGQCLMSSFIGGRSGNRGKCAQACRLKYDVVSKDDKVIKMNDENDKYILSPKDLCSINYLDEVISSGVKSLKIEGRMKDPAYVGKVVKIYREYINMYEENKSNSTLKDQVKIEEYTRELKSVFNRGDFTSGYFFNKIGKSMMSYKIPGNKGIYLGRVEEYDKINKMVLIRLAEDLDINDGVSIFINKDDSLNSRITKILKDKKNVKAANKNEIVYIGPFNKVLKKGESIYKTITIKIRDEINKLISSNNKRIPLNGRMKLKKNEEIILYVEDEDGNNITVNIEVKPDIAINNPIKYESVFQQIIKTGNTPFYFNKLDIEIDDGLIIKKSVLNEYRRKALNEIEFKRKNLRSNKIDIKNHFDYIEELFRKNISVNYNSNKISLYFYKLNNQLLDTVFSAQRIYISIKDYISIKNITERNLFKNKKYEIFIWFPPIIKGNYQRIVNDFLSDKYNVDCIDGVLIGNISLINEFKHKGFNVVVDSNANAMNSASLKYLSSLGISGATLSMELNNKQIDSLIKIKNFDKEIVVYGKIPVMNIENCVLGSALGGKDNKKECNKVCKSGNYFLKDRKNMNFLINCDDIDCRSTLYNSQKLFAIDAVYKLNKKSYNFIRLNILDESVHDINDIINIFENSENYKYNEDNINNIKNNGFTKGHYFRGV